MSYDEAASRGMCRCEGWGVLVDSVEKRATELSVRGRWINRLMRLALRGERAEQVRGFRGPSELGFLEDLQRRALSEQTGSGVNSTRKR